MVEIACGIRHQPKKKLVEKSLPSALGTSHNLVYAVYFLFRFVACDSLSVLVERERDKKRHLSTICAGFCWVEIFWGLVFVYTCVCAYVWQDGDMFHFCDQGECFVRVNTPRYKSRLLGRYRLYSYAERLMRCWAMWEGLSNGPGPTETQNASVSRRIPSLNENTGPCDEEPQEHGNWRLRVVMFIFLTFNVTMATPSWEGVLWGRGHDRMKHIVFAVNFFTSLKMQSTPPPPPPLKCLTTTR